MVNNLRYKMVKRTNLHTNYMILKNGDMYIKSQYIEKDIWLEKETSDTRKSFSPK